MFNKSLKVLLFLTLMVVLAACGGDGDDDSDNGGGGDSGGVDLSQEASSQDPETGISITVNYPESWVSMADSGSVMMANSQELLDAAQGDDVEIADGQVMMVALPIAGEMASLIGLGEDSTTTDAVNMVAGMFFAGPDTETNFNDPEETEINGKSATVMSGSATMNGNTSDGSLIAVQVEGGFAVFIARYAGDFGDEIRAIAGSVEVATVE